MKKKLTVFANISFICISAAILLFLIMAPDETTAPLPRDDQHIRFFAIESKKEAEKFCTTCHSSSGSSSLPESHPPKYRCLFCHKRDS